ncbi:MAG: peptidase M20 [Anaerolineaceae bacterium 4572_32.2]|nr:MAG: peptidase M20 [Anaerolineaceae bacterium 4572_32.2]
MSNQIDFKSQAESLREQLVAWRRDFHAHPEIGFQEHRSAGIIAEQLRELGYQVQTGVAHTGVVGLLEGKQPGTVVMARFDMDALPIAEENETDYVSQNPGVMHGCGHDGHMAIGLGVAALMAQRRDEIAGTLKLVFQPGEEGMNGAEVMMREGVLEKPRPDVVLVTHVWNDAPVGTIDATPGAVMAAAERWHCAIRGKGGHGAQPQRTVDPIVVAAQVVVALQTIVSRNVGPLETAVVTVGQIRGGDAFNVIPSQVQMEGTIRTYDPQVRETVLRRVREVIEGVAAACGAEAELKITPLTPAVVNDAEAVKVVRAAARAVVGPENVFSGKQTMGSEDAAFFLREVPGCYFFLGSANAERGLDAPHHNPRFDFDEGALPLGLAVMMNALGHYLL